MPLKGHEDHRRGGRKAALRLWNARAREYDVGSWQALLRRPFTEDLA